MRGCTAAEPLAGPTLYPREPNGAPTAPQLTSQTAAPPAELPQHAAQHAVPGSTVSVLSLVPPNTAGGEHLAGSGEATPAPHLEPHWHHDHRCMVTADHEAGTPAMGDLAEEPLLGATSTSSHLSESSAHIPTPLTGALLFPLMHSQQVQSSELPAGLVVPRKLAKAAAISATAAAMRASRESCDLEGLPPASPEDTAPHAPTAQHVATGAHEGASWLHAAAGGRISGCGSDDGMHARTLPVAATGGAGVQALRGLRGAAAVPPRTPLATGAARMLALRAAAAGRSGASPHPHDTARDVSLAAAAVVRPPGAGARRSLPFSDEDLAGSSALSLETSADDAGAAQSGPPDAAYLSEDSPFAGAIGDSTIACKPIAFDNPARCTTDADQSTAQAMHGAGAQAWPEASAEGDNSRAMTVATGPRTHELEQDAVTRPSLAPAHTPGLGLDKATEAEGDRSRRRAAAAGGMHGESDEGADTIVSTGVDLLGSASAGEEEQGPGQDDASGSGDAPEEVLQGRLHALDGDLHHLMQRLRMSWDGALVAGGAFDAADRGRSNPLGHGADRLPAHGGCPPHLVCATPDESRIAMAAAVTGGAGNGRVAATGAPVSLHGYTGVTHARGSAREVGPPLSLPLHLHANTF